jgi:predicted DsbA family dithiol-disulfide isomerase
VDNTNGQKILVKGAQPAKALLQAIGQLVEQRNQPASPPTQEKTE